MVERALAKQPADRYPSAGDLARAARAATGASVTPRPERVVARGAAAPEGAPREPGLAGELPTLSHGAAAPTVVRRRWPGRSGLAWLLTAALVVAAGLAVALVAPWEDGAQTGSAARPGPAATPTPRPTARAPGPRSGLVIEHVGGKPNGIALAGGDVWVSSYDRPSLTRLDAARGRKRAAHPGRAGVRRIS